MTGGFSAHPQAHSQQITRAALSPTRLQQQGPTMAPFACHIGTVARDSACGDCHPALASDDQLGGAGGGTACVSTSTRSTSSAHHYNTHGSSVLAYLLEATHADRDWQETAILPQLRKAAALAATQPDEARAQTFRLAALVRLTERLRASLAAKGAVSFTVCLVLGWGGLGGLKSSLGAHRMHRAASVRLPTALTNL